MLLKKLEYRTTYVEKPDVVKDMTKEKWEPIQPPAMPETKVKVVVKSINASESTDGRAYPPEELETNLRLITRYIAEHPGSNYPEVIQVRE